MYEDSWYTYVPDHPKEDAGANSSRHGRRESLLKQSNVRLPSLPLHSNPQLMHFA